MITALTCLGGSPINLTGGLFSSGKGLSKSILTFVNITIGGWSAPSFTNSYFAPKDTSGDAFPNHLPPTILWLCFVTTAYHTPVSSLMDGYILIIGNVTIWISTCVPLGVH